MLTILFLQLWVYKAEIDVFFQLSQYMVWRYDYVIEILVGG